jgi:hypothetical protein
MIEPDIRFPVVCPKCGRERLAELPLNEVVYALNRGSDISLVATCHDVIWTATELELEQIQQYLLAHKGGSDKSILEWRHSSGCNSVRSERSSGIDFHLDNEDI